MAEIRKIVNQVLSQLGTSREARYYLRQYSQDDLHFAVIKIGGAALDEQLGPLASALAFLANLGLMGLAEMICRWRLRRRGVKVRVVSMMPVAGLVLFGAGVYVIFLWGMGVHYFYLYMEGYKAIFH